MADNLEELLDEYSIPYITSGQNSSKDYVNICCEGVDCCVGDIKYKRGIHRSMTRSYCWSGGGGVSIYDLVKSLGIPWNEWKSLMLQEAEEWNLTDSVRKYKDEEPEPEEAGIMIPGEALHPVHKEYLKSRGFDPDFLEKEFGVKGILDNGQYYAGTDFWKEDYKLQYRIIIPIHYNGVPISYLGRSYLPDIDNRYMCCDPELEHYFHKFSVFNLDRAGNGKVLLVEGTLDVINLVQASGDFRIVASYGTQITDEQLQLLRRRFEEVIVLYDPERKAQDKAMKIVSYLESYGVKARNIKLKLGEDVDPGNLDKETAKFLVEKLLGD